MAVAVTRAFGVRVPAGALLSGAAINAGTHYLLDRRRPLHWLAGKFGSADYLRDCQVVRTAGGPAQPSGPGTALFELDQSAHRFIGLLAAAATTMLTARARRRR